MINEILNLIKKENILFVDLRFTDLLGIEQHMTVCSNQLDDIFFNEGKLFDGSSILGWKAINSSDMILMPDIDSYYIDPFFQDKTLVIKCDIVEPMTTLSYNRDPRAIARKAEEYLKNTGIGEDCLIGPEPEFFLLDDVRWKIDMNESYYSIDSIEAAWNSKKKYSEGNMGYRPNIKGGYFPTPPIDSAQDIRSAISKTLINLGYIVENHHHEVATGCQNEIITKFNTLKNKADEIQIIKYVIKNIALMYGKSATFMPKPIINDNGSGMHIHQSIIKEGKNIFSGDEYSGLSKTALYYIGGIIKHAKAINAFTNCTTNSYKRLIPGFEAPIALSYSAKNRSSAIRIPHTIDPKKKRIEVRFPDSLANPYLAFSAILMAGIDGIKNKIYPGDPIDKNLYDLPLEEAKNIPSICENLQEALENLKKDSDFLLEGEVFSKDLINTYINIKSKEILQLNSTTHPVEFDMYYKL